MKQGVHTVQNMKCMTFCNKIKYIISIQRAVILSQPLSWHKQICQCVLSINSADSSIQSEWYSDVLHVNIILSRPARPHKRFHFSSHLYILSDWIVICQINVNIYIV